MPTPEQLAADAAADTVGATPGLNVLVERLVELRSQVDATEASLKEVKKTYDDLRKRILPQALGDNGLTSVRTSLGMLSLRTKTYASVPVDRRGECREWLLTRDLADVLVADPKALLALVTSMIQNGHAIPDFIRTYNEETVVLTRKKE